MVSLLLLGMLAAGLAVLIIGADVFVGQAGKLALTFRIPPLVVGLTLVAFGTSLPELAVSLNAALEGNPGLAVGNVIGSNLANTLLILGLAASLTALPVSRECVLRDGAWWIIATLGFVLAAQSGGIGRLEGACLLAGLALYLFTALRGGVDFAEEVEQEDAPRHGARNWLIIAGSLGAIWAGSELAVHGAVGLAGRLGVSDTVVGLTVVALGTSLPELATTLACLRKRGTDMLIGGIVGSNIFNIFAILGITGTVATLPVAHSLVTFDLPLLMIISVGALVMLRTGWVVSRREGIVLLGGYAAYLGTTAYAI
ncbi:calcium/sodium antiporter [Roseivivax sp. GX 12232]|uniref:calcium/sodium antiporter n=1 Tax=Roseivivax sp. GX 12232 TaxID=2900547 RepID=UPI001E3C211C|nr:calcium/sodium antiporter [Roseivivax sp. GX 12232]MCE0504103.1 calcium/sodium antiporter [Roseivivax sp. GX 12232]